MIRVENLSKVYGHGDTAVHSLRGLDFEVEQGEFVAVMGRSGSGKSTLLHLLGLLDRPTGGRIHIDGIDVLRLSEPQRARFRLEKTGYVFQEHSLVPELTLLENVYLTTLCLMKEKNYRKRAMEMLRVVGLEDRVHHYPNQVSGGEQQRAAIARAAVNGPRILFADEPTASLDAISSDVVLRLFKSLNQELGQTIVMVTHEPEDEKFVDRVVWLKDGLIECQDYTGSREQALAETGASR